MSWEGAYEGCDEGPLSLHCLVSAWSIRSRTFPKATRGQSKQMHTSVCPEPKATLPSVITRQITVFSTCAEYLAHRCDLSQCSNSGNTVTYIYLQCTGLGAGSYGIREPQQHPGKQRTNGVNQPQTSGVGGAEQECRNAL